MWAGTLYDSAGKVSDDRAGDRSGRSAIDAAHVAPGPREVDEDVVGARIGEQLGDRALDVTAVLGRRAGDHVLAGVRAQREQSVSQHLRHGAVCVMAVARLAVEVDG